MSRSSRQYKLSRLLGCAILAGLSAAATAQVPYTGPQVTGDDDLLGSWSFSVTSLARTETAIGPVTTSAIACLKAGAKPATFPLMAKPLQGRCAMIRTEVKTDYLSVIMQCEEFERSTHLSLHLQPRKDGAYAGRYSFSMTLDDNGDGTMQADATVVARRLGGC